MKVRIERVYDDLYENIINDYPQLEGLGVKESDGLMYLEIETLDELKEIRDLVNHSLVFRYDEYDDIIVIEIYDDYRE